MHSYTYKQNKTNAFIFVHIPTKPNQCIHTYAKQTKPMHSYIYSTNQTKPINIPFNLPKYVINQSFDMKGLK